MGVSCKCTVPGRERSQFFEDVFWNFCWAGDSWRVGVVNLAVLARVLRATTKKGHELFEEKSAPPPDRKS